MHAAVEIWDFGGTPSPGTANQKLLPRLLGLSVLAHIVLLFLLPMWKVQPGIEVDESLRVSLVPEQREQPPPAIVEEITVTPRSLPLPQTPVAPVTPVEPATQEQTDTQPSVLPGSTKSQLEWVQEGKQVAEQLLREQADRQARQLAQWFRAPSIMWGKIPRVFDREYVLTQLPPTGLLGDPNELYKGFEFKGIGIPIGKNCFLGLPKVDVEQQYREYANRLPTVYPEPEVATLNLYSCGFSTSGN
ncbi:MAG: hypothetical protein AAF438_21540 [Pseudomonadota bacterium]